MTPPTRQVSLPEHLCDAAEKKFGNLETFLTFVLGELLRDEARALDDSERHMLEQRLRDLGYL